MWQCILLISSNRGHMVESLGLKTIIANKPDLMPANLSGKAPE